MTIKVKTSSPNRKKVKSRAKAKTPTLAQLKKRLWTVFSQYIRLRDADSKGYVYCVCSGTKMFWQGSRKQPGTEQANSGHFLGKKICPPLYFEESNVHVQSSYINSVGEGMQYQHGLYIIKKYGQAELDRLFKVYNDYREAKIKNPKYTYRWNKQELEDKIKYYTPKVKEEKLKRGLL